MKVSETVIPKTQSTHGTTSSRRKQSKSSADRTNITGNGDRRNGNDIKAPISQQSTTLERTLKVKNSLPSQNIVAVERKGFAKAKKDNDDLILSPDIKQVASFNSSTTATNSNIKKPWIPCTRRPSKPKPPPATLEMELSLVDPSQVCKKYPKSPSPDSLSSTDTDKQKCKQTSNSTIKHTNSHYMTSTISSAAAAANTGLTEKRTKLVLQRQFALDNACCNLKESISDDSLNSINSVTQLLKIERSAFAFNSKNKRGMTGNVSEDDEEEEMLTGVKLIAAKLEAKNLANKSGSNGSCSQNEFTKKNNKRSNENILHKSSDDGGPHSKATSYHQLAKQNNLINNNNNDAGKKEEKKRMTEPAETIARVTNLSPSAEDRHSNEARNTEKSFTAKSSETSSSASSLLTVAVAVANAAAVTTSSRAERKIVNSKNATSLSSTSGRSNVSFSGTQQTKVKSLSSSSTPPTSLETKKQSSSNKLKSVRSRSTSPVKSQSGIIPTKPLQSTSLASERKNISPATPISIEETKSKPFISRCELRARSRSNSATRRHATASTATTPALPTSLVKQANHIKDKKEEQSRRSRVSTIKSRLISASSATTASTGTSSHDQAQEKAVPSKNTDTLPTESKNNDSQQIIPKRCTASVSSTSSATVSNRALESRMNKGQPSFERSFGGSDRNTYSSWANKETRRDTKLSEVTTTPKCKSDAAGRTPQTQNNVASVDRTNTITKNKRREESDISLSSLSSTSSASLPTRWRSRLYQKVKKEPKKKIVIPSIVMSEYVEGNENGKETTIVGQSKNLFTPLQFIEPLEPTCDIVEGSCLELKVRVRGAEAVIWVKEDKIIPNAPPDFQYFQETSKDVYGLRIADAFIQDSGLYVCEAYGAGGNEITCWCEVDVLEAATNEDDDEISWEDLDISEGIKSPQPLVVPVIVTSQPESDTYLSLNTAQEMDLSSVEKVTAEPASNNVGKYANLSAVHTEEKCQMNSGHATSNNSHPLASSQDQCPKKLIKNESALMNSNKLSRNSIEEEENEEQCSNVVKSHSCSEVATVVNYATDEATSSGHPVAEFASVSAIKETRLASPLVIKRKSVTTATSAVAMVEPSSEMGHLHVSSSQEDDKRKLVSELSSASDESIYLKETRSGDEGALSAEETSASLFEIKSAMINDEDNNAVAPDSPQMACSPCSDQNGRSESVDSAIGFLGRPLFSDGKFPPRILVGPSSILALYGEVVHLRVKVQNYGIPKTSVNWFKFVNGTYKKIEQNSGDQTSAADTDAHVSVTNCGSLSTLTIAHINYDDCGRYRVKVQNLLGMDSHDCLLTVEGPPEAPSTPPKVKYDDKSKTILIQWSSCPYDGGSKITGYYVEASIVQGSKTAINKDDQDQWQLLTPQSYSWLCYTLTNPKRGSVYKFRVFGENIYGRGKPTEPSLPLLVPMLMEGRRAGSSDALLWSLKSLNQEETVLRANSNKIVREHENETAALQEEPVSSQEEELVEYKNVELKRDSFSNVYDKLDELGKGRFGVVFEVVHKETKKSCAGKFVKCIKSKDKERVQLEVKIMNDLGYHPKLICLIDAFEMPREIVIVAQRIDGGELFERVVADDFTLTEGDCITFLRQICDAVGYIHGKNIMHLDLKPENILCTSKNSNQIKIIDFGLAQYYDPKEPIRVLFGTAEFVSPEIINYETIAPSTDNWSLGVITYILLSGLSPFMGDNDNETFSNITRAEFDFEDEAFEKISDDAKDFISNLLVKRPEKRMTAEKCLNHRWLESEHKKDVILSTDKLKRFIVRRKWQKTGNAIRALGRITTLYSSRRSSSTSSTTTPTGSVSTSVSSPPSLPFSPSRTGSLITQDSMDNDSVFVAHPPCKKNQSDNDASRNEAATNLNFNNVLNQQSQCKQLSDTKHQAFIDTHQVSSTTTSRTKYSDPSRSDSGVCDVSSFSSSFNYD